VALGSEVLSPARPERSDPRLIRVMSANEIKLVTASAAP
jgi:hypothetical protein